MAIVKSDQLTNQEARPYVPNAGRDVESALRHNIYEFFPSAEPSGSTIRLGRLRKGWRLLGMRFGGPAIGAAGATMSLGIAGNTTKYSIQRAIDAAFQYDVASFAINGTVATFYGEVLASDVELIGTTAGNALLTSVVNKLVVVVRFTAGA